MKCPKCNTEAEVKPDYMDKPMRVTQLFDKIVTTYVKVNKVECLKGHEFFIPKEENNGKDNR